MRKHALELLDAKILRGAEGYHGIVSRPSAIRRDRQCQVLERPACGSARPIAEGNGRGNRLHQFHRPEGERGLAGGDQKIGQEHVALPYGYAEGRVAERDATDLQMGEEPGWRCSARPACKRAQREDELTTG